MSSFLYYKLSSVLSLSPFHLIVFLYIALSFFCTISSPYLFSLRPYFSIFLPIIPSLFFSNSILLSFSYPPHLCCSLLLTYDNTASQLTTYYSFFVLFFLWISHFLISTMYTPFFATFYLWQYSIPIDYPISPYCSFLYLSFSLSHINDVHSSLVLFYLQPNTIPMDQRAFVFATRGQCIKGKQCQHITIKNQIFDCIQNNLAYFPFMYCPLVGNQKWHWSIYYLSLLTANLLFPYFS